MRTLAEVVSADYCIRESKGNKLEEETSLFVIDS